jgi:uncharacterized membrane protein
MAAKKAAAKPSSKDVDEGKAFAFLGVFLGIIGFVIVLLAKKDNKYAMYYAKQGLVLTIAWVVLWIAAWILMFIPFIGWLIMIVAWIALMILWIIGWINALSGTEKPIPFIGQFGDKFNI